MLFFCPVLCQVELEVLLISCIPLAIFDLLAIMIYSHNKNRRAAEINTGQDIADLKVIENNKLAALKGYVIFVRRQAVV